MRAAAALALSLLMTAPGVTAGEILAAGVSKHDRVYHASIDALIAAPVAVVYGAITDYANLSALNPSILESTVEHVPGPDRYRVRSVIRVCILVYCKRVHQVQNVVHRDDYSIEAEMVPGAGDFRSGFARWRLAETTAGTRLMYTHRFEPDFWVPPVIGTWLIERKLVSEVRETARQIEDNLQVARWP